jgi:hypothetical protein
MLAGRFDLAEPLAGGGSDEQPAKFHLCPSLLWQSLSRAGHGAGFHEGRVRRSR